VECKNCIEIEKVTKSIEYNSNDTNFRVSEIERKLAINDTKTQMSIDLNWKTIAVIGSFLTLIAGVVVNSIWG